MRLGMDVARLNFSHGTYKEHVRNIERLRRTVTRQRLPSESGNFTLAPPSATMVCPVT